MRAAALLCALILASPTAAQSGVCPAWGKAEPFGALDAKLVNEASGLEVSDRFGDRLYHNNDSGDGLRFYVSGLKGEATRAIDVEGPDPRDIEELSLGPCGRQTCLYLGDIGDNPGKRDGVVFTLVIEKKAFKDKVKPLRTVRARYPDGAHNAEAFAVHPNGDLFLVTKPVDARMATPGPALVYRLTAAQLRNGRDVQTFAKVGEIDLPTIMAEFPFPGSIATALDISADGRRALLLTYVAALVLDFDLAEGLSGPHQVVRLNTMPQQEAGAWLPDGSGFLYDTELTRGAKAARIDRVVCKDAP
ncbi:MAG: hypothetical protein Q8Q88_09155 [Phenylobacterium sp.]|uniref:hypothetical protein n=1 Tax=Phenylobacterium sp. TaxID=1871053 RepID=UPI002733FFAF|nr:hypothetical protein [Phenylobacterium sp.]MDP3747200.1 hypothetical protein [Phenylobacterium sp.]